MSGAQISLLRGESPRDRQRDRLRRLAHRQPLLVLCAAAVCGILCDTWWEFHYLVWVTSISVLLFAVAVIPVFVRGNANRWIGLLMVALFLPLGALRHNHYKRGYDSASMLAIANEVASPAIIEGIVDWPCVLRRHPLADQPSRRERSPWQTHVEVSVQRIRNGDRFETSDGRVLAVVEGRCDELLPGDPIRIFGSLRRFEPPTNPGERDLREIYRQRWLHARVEVDTPEQIELLGDAAIEVGWLRHGWLRVNRMVGVVGKWGREGLLHFTSESTGPLAVALVIGQRDFVDNATRDALLVTGTAHLLSVSGMHLAIIVVLVGAIVTLLGGSSDTRMFAIIVACICYTAITGARPPVIRAAILVAILIFAIGMRRPSQSINTLSLAALILLFWNPQNVFSVGVQLSFLAVATLITCSRRESAGSAAVEQSLQQEARIDALVESSRSWPIFMLRLGLRTIGQLAWFSGCVTCLSLPLVWYQFHVVSPISVVANVVLSPFLFLALASGVGTLVGGVVRPVGAVCGLICTAMLWSMKWLIETAAQLPWGHFWLPAPPMWWVIVFYLVIAASLLVPVSRKLSGLRILWIASWIFVAYLLATSPSELEDESVEAIFVDVGHGTSVVLRFAEDEVWLYDCGRLGNDTGSSRDIDATLWSLGVMRLEGIILSHADADHFNALPGLLRRFTVRRIVTPPGMLAEPEPALDVIRAEIKRHDIDVWEVSDGDAISAADHQMHVLHPPAQRLAGSDNANSLVIRIDCGGESLVLPGDLESPGTEALIRHPRPPAGSVLMAPHHGSLTMDATSVLNWSRPRETVVSGGQRAGKPEVQRMLSATGSGVHVTNQVGAIRVLMRGNGEIELRSWNQSPW